MGAFKNMLRGFLFTSVFVVVTIIIPLILFSVVYDIAGFYLEWDAQAYNEIIFWLIAFGLIISGIAFFKYSSPKKSIRRAIFALIQVIVNCFYIWSFKFSGAAEITITIQDWGFFSLNLSQMLLVYMGIYFLTIVIRVYDVIDFTINREKIREERMKN
ncbi:MAG: hypothetical protein ACFFFB_09295 [Candidatus Heimdallarchaeota archaeon]